MVRLALLSLLAVSSNAFMTAPTLPSRAVSLVALRYTTRLDR